VSHLRMDLERTPAAINEDRRDRWLHGRCALFAAALHRVTGLPIRAWLQDDPDLGVPVLVHAFVVRGEEAVDASGVRDPFGLLAGYEHWEPFLVDMTEVEVLAIGEPPEIDPAMLALAITDACIVAAALAPVEPAPSP
jgi:hypothetical protein